MTHAARRPGSSATELERPLVAVETQLAAMGAALQGGDPAGVDGAAAELHVALAAAVDHFTRAARDGGVPAPLRHRLAIAGGQVAVQREALARATASLDRALDVLLPRHVPHAVYAVGGTATRIAQVGGQALA